MNTFLPGLGISDAALAQQPTAEVFPRAFSQNLKHIWKEVVHNLDIQCDPVEVNWGLAIKGFIEACVDRDLFPFSSLQQSTNDVILNRLVSARRAVVRFLNLSGMLDLTDIRATRRQVLMMNQGFVLRVYGKATIKDPTFTEWLLKKPYPGFKIKHEGRYLKGLGNNVNMVVYNEGANGMHRWHVGYEIKVNAYPDIPGHPMPSKAELETFVLKVLWAPVMKAQRPYKYQVRPL